MLFSKFKKDCIKYWSNYFKDIARNSENIQTYGVILYPSHIIFINFGDYFGIELLGAELEPKILRPKIAKYKCVEDYFNFFNDTVNTPLIQLTNSGIRYTNLCFAHEGDLDIAQNRFPFIDLYPTKLVRKGGRGSIVAVDPSLKDVVLENCAIVNHREGLFRAKNILFLAIFNHHVTSIELKNFFKKLLEEKDGGNYVEIHGIFTVTDNQEAATVASQLQNLYLSSGIHETTIGDFLSQRPEILKSAFKTDHFVYEPYLEWIEHDGSVEAKAINPDLFIKRADGKYDIVDLKLALLGKENITTSSRARRRFIASVNDGIAQLAHYEFYFTFERNRQFAFEKFGIEVDNPQLTLVVGSMENVDYDTVIQALRPYKNINIIDYDTLVSIYLEKENNNP